LRRSARVVASPGGIAQFGWSGGEQALRGEIESQRRGARPAGILLRIT